jgi:hypothetical protein
MEFQVHTTTAKRWPVLLTFHFIGLVREGESGVNRIAERRLEAEPYLHQ